MIVYCDDSQTLRLIETAADLMGCRIQLINYEEHYIKVDNNEGDPDGLYVEAQDLGCEVEW